MAIIPFPKVPEVAAGQVVGETYLMLLGRATDYLLGESHAAEAAPNATASLSRYFDEYGDPGGDGATYYLYHASDTLAYAFIGGNTSAGKTWYVQLDYYGDDSAWHTVQTWSDTTSPSWQSGTLDLSAEANLTVGTIYAWRFQTKTSDETYYTTLQVWMLATRTAVSGWVAPPTFTAATSDPDDCNALCTDLNALYAGVVPAVNPLAMCERAKEQTNTQDTYEAFARYSYRYRPNGIHVALWGMIGGGQTWYWRVLLTDSAGNEAEVYESAELASSADYVPQSTNIDLTSGGAAAAIAAAGITLTRGTSYLVTIEAKRTSTNQTLYLKNAMVIRTSDGAAAAGWAVPEAWAHGDTDLGPTGMNKYSTDLAMLYTGGDEVLYGDHHAVRYHDEDNVYGGAHRKRYLVYRAVEGESPTVLYGTSYATDYGLPSCAVGAGEQWLSYDLTGLTGLAVGAYYYVTEAGAAWESDTPYA
jgi:hypothetical protein